MSIMIATFAIVMRIQRQIGSKYKDLRSSIARVITALCFMGLCAGGALFAYVGSQSFLHSPEPPGSTYWGGSIGGIIARLYGLCTMYVWYTIINIVRGRTHESKDSVPSFGDLRLQQGSALEKPMPTHYGSAPRPTYTGISIQQQQLQQQVASLRYSDQSQHQYPQQPDVYSMSVRGPSSQYSTQQPQQQQQQQQHPASQYSLSIRVPSQQYPSQSRGSQLNVQYGSQSRYQEPPTSPSVMSWHSDSRYSVAPRAPTQSHVGN
ncbi:hypothetical protein BC828DRAFT_31629 [Blastocladiella britannica]|nr:hypothetical protein BC828DRAFT_31629 [Blastocladiella britannica]